MNRTKQFILFHPLRWFLRLTCLLTFIGSCYLVLRQNLWIDALGGTSPITTGAVSALYLTAESSFFVNRKNEYEAFVAAVLFCNAFIHSFELIYHFTFPVYLNYFVFPFLGGQEVRYLLMEATTLLPLFLIRKHLSLKRICIAPLAVFLILWAVWILYGYPQYFIEGYFYPRLLTTTDPFILSLSLNFGSKAVLAILFATLLNIANTLESLHAKRRLATDIQSPDR